MVRNSSIHMSSLVEIVLRAATRERIEFCLLFVSRWAWTIWSHRLAAIFGAVIESGKMTDARMWSLDHHYDGERI